MATQILIGSTGKHVPLHAFDKMLGNTVFTVTQDTCMESNKIPVKFNDDLLETWILMKNVVFTKLLMKDL